MVFKDIAIGSKFHFDSVRGFSALCTKISARKYSWVHDMTGQVLSTRVGTIYVEVVQVTE